MDQCSVIQFSVQCSSVEVKCSVVSAVLYLILWIPVGAGDKRAIGQIGMGRQTAGQHTALLWYIVLFLTVMYFNKLD